MRCGDRAGVWFFSLDAASRLAVAGARLGFGLPYLDARIRCERVGEAVHHHGLGKEVGEVEDEVIAATELEVEQFDGAVVAEEDVLDRVEQFDARNAEGET